ncbi:MAG: ribosome small subunit-dependent GTPase A [Dehalococcoidia bacterium]|nr:ribosome small subunit-dependent GTPase A [Dehalococcoidia bacterium]
MNDYSQHAGPDTGQDPDNRGDQYANLVQYGLTGPVRDGFARLISRDPELVPGRVARIDGITTLVHANTRDFHAVSTFATIAPGPDEDEPEIEPAQPTVGDWVLVRPGPANDPDTIELVLPRTSLLVRKRVMRGKEQGNDQLLVSNVDSVFIVQTVTYFNVTRLEREIALVWGSGSTPVVVLSKTDLLEDAAGVEEADPAEQDEQDEQAEMAEIVAQAESVAPGIEVFAVSGMTGQGTDSLLRFTTVGKTVVFIGASGVGKSTLVNQLAGEEVMDTGEIRESDARGRHTTVTRQLLPLPGGGVLIDTPGIRTIGLVSGSEDALAKTFSEIEDFVGECRFRDCRHGAEPGCAIAEAIADGRLLQSRFDSYRRMLRELQHEETKNDPTARTDHQKRMRIIARSSRQRNRFQKRNASS